MILEAQPDDTAVCSTCGTTGTPQPNVAMGLLKAVGAVLIVPAVMVIVGAMWGPDVIHENSMFLTLVFFGTIAGAVSLFKGALIGACPSCGTEPMVLLSTPQGQHIVENIKFRKCPKCQKPFKLDTSILKTTAKDQAVASLPCPSCRSTLSVDMTNFEIMAP